MDIKNLNQASGMYLFFYADTSSFGLILFLTDPFAKSFDGDGKDNSKVHIRIQQRNGRKCITLIQGLADDLDVKRIARALKKNYQCNGSILVDEENGEILQLSGDQRTNVRDFLVKQEICFEDQIVIHGG